MIIRSSVSLFVLTIVIFGSSYYNALGVYVDDSLVGYVHNFENWSSQALHEDAVQELRFLTGLDKVDVDQVVTVAPVRVQADEIVHWGVMRMRIINYHFTYRPFGIAIYISHAGQYRREALVRGMADVEEVKYLLAQRLRTPNTLFFELIPKWQLEFVEIDGNVRFHTPQEAYAILDATSLLSVIVIEERWVIEVLPRWVERVYVDTLPTAHTRVIQEGSDGEIVIITRTTRKGAEIIDEEEIPGEVIVNLVPMIVEVGR